MTANDICEKAKNLASMKTLYVKGCPCKKLNRSNKLRYANSNTFNSKHAKFIFAADEDTMGIDEIQMFNFLFPSNRFTNLGEIMDRCHDISKDFDSIIPGEVVFFSDRAGIYIGNGDIVTCFDSGISITKAVGVSHGKMMFVDYVDNELVDIVEKATEMEKAVNSIVEEINNEETNVEVRDGGTGSGDRVHELSSQAKSYDRGNGRRRS